MDPRRLRTFAQAAQRCGQIQRRGMQCEAARKLLVPTHILVAATVDNAVEAIAQARCTLEYVGEATRTLRLRGQHVGQRGNQLAHVVQP